PGWSWDIQACGYITVNDLTIIGSGSDQTLIGPPKNFVSGVEFSPHALVHTDGGSLSLQDLAVRNCYTGVYVIGTVMMDRCLVDNNAIGVFWSATGSGGWIGDSVIQSTLPLSPTGLWVKTNGGGSGISMQRCRSEGVETVIDSIDGMTIVDSEFTDEIVGISIYNNARVYMHNSVVANMSRYGVVFSLGSNGYCEIQDSEVSGGWAALYTGQASYGRFVVYGSRLQGGSVAVLNAYYRPGPCLIMGCDLIKGTGPVVQCSLSYETVTHDMRNNYWGTTSEADIQSWIIDHNDDPNIPATVLYSPFDGQPVSIESTTWGDLKALYR
ncbi:MAG: hypothetical protein KAH56_03235, partial [Candidatus Krumholzibacteria bacterium]|nr:hypothetical protein [Candidatus Krumholzibacteria bacterium]